MYLQDLIEYYESHNDDKPDKSRRTGYVVGFSIISIIYFITFFSIIHCIRFCKEFKEWNAIRIIMPAISLFLCIENATIAYDYATLYVDPRWTIAVYIISSTIAPGIFFFSFIMTFLAYRTRSLPFCFVHRGPSRQNRVLGRDDGASDEACEPLVQPTTLVLSMYGFGIGLLALNILVNFNVLSEYNLVGITGWSTVVMNLDDASTGAIIISLVPMALVCLFCFYFACLLWRYGCVFAMTIYTTFCTVWMAPFFGAVAMIVGQAFGPDLFLITSEIGILYYIISMVGVLYEIRYDIRQSGDLGNFLNALEEARPDYLNNTNNTNEEESTKRVTDDKKLLRMNFGRGHTDELQSSGDEETWAVTAQVSSQSHLPVFAEKSSNDSGTKFCLPLCITHATSSLSGK